MMGFPFICTVIKKNMKSKKFTYIVVLQNSSNERVIRVFEGTFNQVVKKARFICPSDYFICEIKIA